MHAQSEACTLLCSNHSRAVNINMEQKIAALRAWLEMTQTETPLSDLELVLAPTRIVEFGQSELELQEEEKQDMMKDGEKSVAEKTSTVVQEVIEQEKRNEGEKKP